jgi:hypothetical protein
MKRDYCCRARARRMSFGAGAVDRAGDSPVPRPRGIYFGLLQNRNE